MKTKRIIRTAGVSPGKNRNRCSRVREKAADSCHPPSHLGGHNRSTATAFLVAASCLCLLSPAIAAPGSRTQKADMPAPTSTPASCVVDKILYVMGGHYPYRTALKTVWAYDPQTDSWTQKAGLPAARRCSGAAAVDGIIYVVGGNNGVGWTALLPIAAYDPKTDIWVTKANIPTGRSTPAVCAVDGIVYAIGGFTDQNVELARVDAYDPKTDQWSRKRDLPRPIYFSTASVVAGLIYVFQGNDTFAYDPQTDQRTNKARFSPWSSGTMSVTVDGTIYLFGGMRQGRYGTGYDFALAYDPAQDRFSARRKMPRPPAGSVVRNCRLSGINARPSRCTAFGSSAPRAKLWTSKFAGVTPNEMGRLVGPEVRLVVVTSQKRTVPSAPPLTRVLPSGRKSKLVT